MDDLIIDWLANQPGWVALVIFPGIFVLNGGVIGWWLRGLIGD